MNFGTTIITPIHFHCPYCLSYKKRKLKHFSVKKEKKIQYESVLFHFTICFIEINSIFQINMIFFGASQKLFELFRILMHTEKGGLNCTFAKRVETLPINQKHIICILKIIILILPLWIKSTTGDFSSLMILISPLLNENINSLPNLHQLIFF
uniref:Uncharacterized protein n=1 Tax=Tetranychus urticae TaxID=32264 RepID=T1KM13_TETUR